MSNSDFGGGDSESNQTEPNSLDSDDRESAHRSGEKGADEKYCSSCGKTIKSEAEICPECGVRQQDAPDNTQKDPGIAAVLSFLFPGVGQIYNGQIGKGIALLILTTINVILMVVIIGFFTYLITWIYCVYDAYNTAKKINNGEIKV